MSGDDFLRVGRTADEFWQDGEGNGGSGGADLYECQRCWAVVIETGNHLIWHDERPSSPSVEDT